MDTTVTEGRYAAVKVARLAPRPCEHCGTLFVVAEIGRPARTCSPECKAARNRAKERERRAAGRDRTHAAECEWCGHAFRSTRSPADRRAARYCTQRCATIALAFSGKSTPLPW